MTKQQIFIDRPLLKVLIEDCLTMKELSVRLDISLSEASSLVHRFQKDSNFGKTLFCLPTESTRRSKPLPSIFHIKQTAEESFSFDELASKLGCQVGKLRVKMETSVDPQTGENLKSVIRRQLAWNRSMRNYNKSKGIQ